MKRWTILAVVALVVLAAVVLSERRKAMAPVSPDPLLYFVADTEHELTRLPVAATRWSDAEEIKIGDEMAREYLRRPRAESDEAQPGTRTIEGYVQRVGSRVAAYAHRKLPYKFHYVPDGNFMNAFALPGGHVFVGAGLMNFMDSEDELASVLGHEIEHIDHYHCAERAQLEMRVRKIPLGGLVALPAEIFMAGYSKDQELESDREGTKLAVWAGYSPLGALRMFESFERLYSEYVTRAQSPQEELSQVAEQTIRDYFRSHPATSARIAQIRAMIAAEHWESRTRERDLEVAYFFWTKRAREACEAGKYERCEGLAKRSLAMNPSQPLALETLADALFMQANFSGAAESLRKYLDDYAFNAKRQETYAHDMALLDRYSEALAASGNPAQSAAKFRAWLASRFGSAVPDDAQADFAGLQLLAGNDTPASEAVQPDSPGLLVGRIGWWNYRAGRYADAVALLTRAVEQLPGDEALTRRLGWALIEQHKYGSALQRFEQTLGNRRVNPWLPRQVERRRTSDDVSMGIAVARWRANQKDEAEKWFSGAIVDRPQWMNPRWVQALYSPLVVKSILEMRVEQEQHHSVSSVHAPE